MREKIVGEYWISLSDEERKEWLQVEISNVVQCVQSIKVSWLETDLEDTVACWTINGSCQSFSCLSEEPGL